VRNCGNFWELNAIGHWQVGDDFFDEVHKQFGLIYLNSDEHFLDEFDNEVRNDELRDTVMTCEAFIRWIYRGGHGLSSRDKKIMDTLVHRKIR